jgi:hypothetical protein
MKTYDVDALHAGWLAGESVSSLAGRVGVGMTTIRNMQAAGKLPWRASQRDDEPEAPSPEEDAASGDSLQLSPWVQSRIRELRIHELREKGSHQGVEVMETRVVAQRKWVR